MAWFNSFIFQYFKGWDSNYLMELTPRQKEACRFLENILVELLASDLFNDNKLEDLESEDESLELEDGKSTETQ